MYWAGCNEWLIKGGRWWLEEALVLSCPSLSGRTMVQAVVCTWCKGNSPTTPRVRLQQTCGSAVEQMSQDYIQIVLKYLL